MRTLALAFAAAACASAEPVSLTDAELAVYPDAAGMPADVQDFIVDWRDCRHWQGEFGEEEARRRQIEKAVRRTCRGINARGRQVRAQHADDPAVLARIADYEALEE